MPTYAITVGGASQDVRKGSLTIHQTLNGLDTLRADIVSADGSYRPTKNTEVIVTEDGTTIFAGPIQTARERWLRSADWDGIVTTIEAVDWTTYGQRRIVDETLAAGTLKSMLTTLVTNYLDVYGVTLHASQANGPSLPELTYTDQQLSAVLSDLATRSGYVYKITYAKKLLFWVPGSSAAPYDITSANGLAVGDIVVEPTNDDFFANTIFIDVTGAGPATSTETFTAGGGSTETYTTAYPASQSINDAWPNVLLVNSVNQGPVKWGDPDGTFAWGWDYTTHTLKHNGSGFVPSNGDTISVTYAIGYPYQVSASDATSITAIGPWEKKIRVAEAVNADAAEDLADAELARRLVDLSRVIYDTYETGALPGDTQTINVTERNINDTYLITDITLTDVGRLDQTLRRTVTAVESQTFQEGWRQTVENWTSLGSGGAGVAATGSVQGALPGGDDTSMQYNDGGSFGGDDNVTWDKTTKTQTVTGDEHDVILTGDQGGTTWGVDGDWSAIAVRLKDASDNSSGLSIAYTGNEDEAFTIGVNSGGGCWLEYDGANMNIYSWTGPLSIGSEAGIFFDPGTNNVDYTYMGGMTLIDQFAPLHLNVTSTPYTIGLSATTKATVYLWNRSSAGTINLPILSAFQAVPLVDSSFFYYYRAFWFKNIGTATLTLDANGSETIEGATTLAIEPGQSVMLEAGATEWKILGSHARGQEIDITTLDGFPGGSSTFLREDGAFSTPPVTSACVSLTHAQIGSLGTTPIEIVPAQGAGVAIVPVGWSIYMDASNGAYSDSSLSLRWGSTTFGTARSGVLNSTTPRFAVMNGVADGETAVDFSVASNQNLSIVATTAVTGGASGNTGKICVSYYVVDTN